MVSRPMHWLFELGFTGSEADWIASLKGATGAQWPQGAYRPAGGHRSHRPAGGH